MRALKVFIGLVFVAAISVAAFGCGGTGPQDVGTVPPTTVPQSIAPSINQDQQTVTDKKAESIVTTVYRVIAPFSGEIVEVKALRVSSFHTLYLNLPSDAKNIRIDRVDGQTYYSRVTFSDSEGNEYFLNLNKDVLVEREGRVQVMGVYFISRVIACPGRCKVDFGE